MPRFLEPAIWQNDKHALIWSYGALSGTVSLAKLDHQAHSHLQNLTSSSCPVDCVCVCTCMLTEVCFGSLYYCNGLQFWEQQKVVQCFQLHNVLQLDASCSSQTHFIIRKGSLVPFVACLNCSYPQQCMWFNKCHCSLPSGCHSEAFMAKFQDEVFSKCLLQFLLSITTNNQTKNTSCTISILTYIFYLFFHINPSVIKQSSTHNKPCTQHPLR